MSLAAAPARRRPASLRRARRRPLRPPPAPIPAGSARRWPEHAAPWLTRSARSPARLRAGRVPAITAAAISNAMEIMIWKPIGWSGPAPMIICTTPNSATARAGIALSRRARVSCAGSSHSPRPRKLRSIPAKPVRARATTWSDRPSSAMQRATWSRYSPWPEAGPSSTSREPCSSQWARPSATSFATAASAHRSGPPPRSLSSRGSAGFAAPIPMSRAARHRKAPAIRASAIRIDYGVRKGLAVPSSGLAGSA